MPLSKTERFFRSNGKLLLTAEFLVIDGALALAIPCKFGQRLKVKSISPREIHWKSLDDRKNSWFEAKFEVDADREIRLLEGSEKDKGIAERLIQIFKILLTLNRDLFADGGYAFVSQLEFPRDWGLGSSSTLLVNLAHWAGVNPYELAERTFGGSGYDLACAENDFPICYQRTERLHEPLVVQADFNPPFKERLFFVHRNQKQNTRHVVAHYRKINPGEKEGWVQEATDLTKAFLACRDLSEFERLIASHERLLSKVLAIPPVKKSDFPDYPGALKSLGAWGGDFMMATGGKAEKEYFRKRGFATILEYDEMVLNS